MPLEAHRGRVPVALLVLHPGRLTAIKGPVLVVEEAVWAPEPV